MFCIAIEVKLRRFCDLSFVRRSSAYNNLECAMVFDMCCIVPRSHGACYFEFAFVVEFVRVMRVSLNDNFNGRNAILCFRFKRFLYQ